MPKPRQKKPLTAKQRAYFGITRREVFSATPAELEALIEEAFEAGELIEDF